MGAENTGPAGAGQHRIVAADCPCFLSMSPQQPNPQNQRKTTVFNMPAPLTVNDWLKLASSPSMSRRGNCHDNALMKSFWSTLKRELIHRCTFATRGDL
jgi:hypothetical protein